MAINGETKTRNVPQLSKDVRRLNALKARRAKVTELDDQIADLSASIAEQLGFAVTDQATSAEAAD